MTETYCDCPKCGEEITFQVEHLDGDDCSFHSASMIATELQPFCKCSFNEAELEAIEQKVTNDFNESLGGEP